MLDRIAPPLAPRSRGRQRADVFIGNRREGGACAFYGPIYDTICLRWSSASSGELVAIILGYIRGAITFHAMGSLLRKRVVLGSEWTTISRAEETFTTHAPICSRCSLLVSYGCERRY